MGDSLQPLKDLFCATVFTSQFELRTSRGGIVTFPACISMQEPVDTKKKKKKKTSGYSFFFINPLQF